MRRNISMSVVKIALVSHGSHRLPVAFVFYIVCYIYIYIYIIKLDQGSARVIAAAFERKSVKPYCSNRDRCLDRDRYDMAYEQTRSNLFMSLE
jgi:hypothetical protein